MAARPIPEGMTIFCLPTASTSQIRTAWLYLYDWGQYGRPLLAFSWASFLNPCTSLVALLYQLSYSGRLGTLPLVNVTFDIWRPCQDSIFQLWSDVCASQFIPWLSCTVHAWRMCSLYLGEVSGEKFPKINFRKASTDKRTNSQSSYVLFHLKSTYILWHFRVGWLILGVNPKFSQIFILTLATFWPSLKLGRTKVHFGIVPNFGINSPKFD